MTKGKNLNEKAKTYYLYNKVKFLKNILLQKQEDIDKLESYIEEKGVVVKEIKEDIILQEKIQEEIKKDMEMKIDIESMFQK